MCGELGHFVKDFPEWKDYTQQKKREEVHNVEGSGAGETFEYLFTFGLSTDDWLIDSGATSHMCHFQRKLLWILRISRRTSMWQMVT